MAATISANSAGGGGLVSSGDASGVLALQTAGVTALSISAAQVVSFTNPVALTTPTINSAQVPTVSGTAPLYMCRAWVNFNGTGTVAIRASGNVSSITDNGVGSYTVNFTTAMPDANYNATSGNSDRPTIDYGGIISIPTAQLVTGSVGIWGLSNSVGVFIDFSTISVSIFR